MLVAVKSETIKMFAQMMATQIQNNYQNAINEMLII
jgi:hypothetical protein